MRTTPRRARILLYAGVTLALAGCGDTDPSQRAPVGAVIGGGQAAPVASAVVIGQVQALGLDQVRFPDPTGLDAAGRRLASRGPEPGAVPESALAIDRSSPEGLLAGALLAVRLEDPAALARLSRPPGSHPRLNEDDAADSARRFLGRSTRTYWDRVAAAVRAGRYQVQARDDAHVTVRVNVGGAAGLYLVEMRKVEDAWYLAG